MMAETQKTTEDPGISAAPRPWCPCCAFAGTCDGCVAARRAAGRALVTFCLCAGRGPGEGHAPGCPDADQPWGPPYLLPVYAERVEWLRIPDARRERGFRWEKNVRRVATGWYRAESDEEAQRYLAAGAAGAPPGEAKPSNPTDAPEYTVAVLDVETTGLPNRPRGFVPRIVEIAVAVVSLPSGRVLDFRASLVDPEAEIPPEASRISGIYDRDVRDKPTWSALWPKVEASLRGHAPVAVVAHSARFDRERVEDECRRTRLAPPSWPWVCSIALAKAHLPGQPSYALQALREALSLPAGTAHRAAGDVTTTANLLTRIVAGRAWSEVVAPLAPKATTSRSEPRDLRPFEQPSFALGDDLAPFGEVGS